MAGASVNDWVVALLMLLISAVVIGLIYLSCKLFTSWRFRAFFGGFDGEEKAVLTKNDSGYGRNGYMIPTVGTSTNEVTLPSGSGSYYQQYDSMLATATTKKESAADLPQSPAQGHGQVQSQGQSSQPQSGETLVTYGAEVKIPSEPPREHTDTSPVSLDSMSAVLPAAVSDFEQPSGGLQRAASCESVSSDTSVMELEPEAPKIGQLEFGLEYDGEVSELVVSVIQARDLETDKVTGNVDSYVRCWLHPNRDHKLQTKVYKESPNPVYKERFLFNIDAGQLDEKAVQFQVCSCDKYARHKLLGETELRLCDIDLRQPIRVWMNLRDMDYKPAEFGDMMFSLSYLPTAERLTVVVVKARHLKWAQAKEQGNCFVKVYLLQNGKKVGKKKTSIKKEEKNPIFNEAMIFSVPASALGSVQLRLSVIEQLPGDGKLQSIGHVIVGSQLSGSQVTHWNQMMSSLRKPVAMWHSLRK